MSATRTSVFRGLISREAGFVHPARPGLTPARKLPQPHREPGVAAGSCKASVSARAESETPARDEQQARDLAVLLFDDLRVPHGGRRAPAGASVSSWKAIATAALLVSVERQVCALTRRVRPSLLAGFVERAANPVGVARPDGRSGQRPVSSARSQPKWGETPPNAGFSLRGGRAAPTHASGAPSTLSRGESVFRLEGDSATVRL